MYSNFKALSYNSMQYQGKWRPSERESGGRGGEEWGDDGGQRWEEVETSKACCRFDFNYSYNGQIVLSI